MDCVLEAIGRRPVDTKHVAAAILSAPRLAKQAKKHEEPPISLPNQPTLGNSVQSASSGGNKKAASCSSGSLAPSMSLPQTHPALLDDPDGDPWPEEEDCPEQGDISLPNQPSLGSSVSLQALVEIRKDPVPNVCSRHRRNNSKQRQL